VDRAAYTELRNADTKVRGVGGRKSVVRCREIPDSITEFSIPLRMDIKKHLNEISVAVLVTEIPFFLTLVYVTGSPLPALFMVVLNVWLIILHLKTCKKRYVGYIIFLTLPILLMALLYAVMSSIGKMC
jgi:hypothetical protein